MKNSKLNATLFGITTLAFSFFGTQTANASLWGIVTELTNTQWNPYQEISFSNMSNRTVLVEVWDERDYFTSKELAPGKQYQLMTSDPSNHQTFAVRISVNNNGRWIAKDYEFWGSDARVFINRARRGSFYMSGYYLR